MGFCTNSGLYVFFVVFFFYSVVHKMCESWIIIWSYRKSYSTILPICLLDNQQCVSALSPLSRSVLSHCHVSFIQGIFLTSLFQLLLLKVQTSVCVCVYARVSERYPSPEMFLRGNQTHFLTQILIVTHGILCEHSYLPSIASFLTKQSQFKVHLLFKEHSHVPSMLCSQGLTVNS